jgi:hypothetical protein
MKPCNCYAYKFPHRKNGGKCEGSMYWRGSKHDEEGYDGNEEKRLDDWYRAQDMKAELSKGVWE